MSNLKEQQSPSNCSGSHLARLHCANCWTTWTDNFPGQLFCHLILLMSTFMVRYPAAQPAAPPTASCFGGGAFLTIWHQAKFNAPNHHQPWSCETSSLYWFSQSSPAPLQTGKPDIEKNWVQATAVMSCVEFLEYNHHLKFKLICHTSISWILSRSPSASSATFSAIPNW